MNDAREYNWKISIDWVPTVLVSRHSEYVAELFFLQNNGNMMEYPTWRKKSNTQQFMNFLKSHRLEPPPLEEPEQSCRQVCTRLFFAVFVKRNFLASL